MEKEWRAEGDYPAQNWTLIPDNVDGAGDWVDREAERIRGWWDDTVWESRAVPALRDTLNDSVMAVREPGTLTTMLHWPLPLPVPSRVRVMLATGGTVEHRVWEQAGFAVDEYPGARMGPGLKCIASRDEVVDGRDLHLSTAAFVFGASTAGVVLVVESGSREVFEFTLSRIPVILSTLRVYGPDGLELKSNPVAGVSRNLKDEWEIVPNA